MEKSTTTYRNVHENEKEMKEEGEQAAKKESSSSSSSADNNNNDFSTNEEEQWKEWVPMDYDLYNTLQIVQLCMLQKLDEMFCDANIQYWICGGTLLGAIRHDGFIPHDDDIDIECFQDDIDTKIDNIPLDPPLYTGLHSSSSGNEPQWQGYPVRSLNFFNDLFKIDIFPRPSIISTEVSTTRNTNTVQRQLPQEKEKYFPCHDEVFPLSRYTFHNIQVWGPNREYCTSYLDRCYGKDWNNNVCVWNHDYNWYYNTGFNPRKQVMSLQRYNSIIEEAINHTELSTQPQAERTSQETYLKLLVEYDLDDFYKRYKKYSFERVIRRNRIEAEYREQLLFSKKGEYNDDSTGGGEEEADGIRETIL